MKWAGFKEFRGMPINENLAKGYLTAICRTDEGGTFQHDMEPVLLDIPGLAIQKHPQPTRWEVKGCLKSDGIVLLDSPWWDKEKRQHVWHYSLFIDVIAKGKLYYVINNIDGTSKTLITGRSLAKMLTKDRRVMAYFIWKDTGWTD
jgi:hypothetical protein